ncbi:hypothetical protein HBI64_013950 [Parastagonospora nodorum]|nr:hypothetical protein HBI64_013950 [Parastagonospora nodorum]
MLCITLSLNNSLSFVIDALTMTLIKDDDDLLGTVNSYIKLRRLRARRKTEAADSRYAKVSGGRTKKDKDLEDSDTSSDVLRLRRRDRAAACARSAERKRLLDSDDYCLDSSSDINSKDDSEDEEATTAKDLAREQKERLKALLNAKTRDGLSARVGTAMEYCTLEDSQTHISSTLKSCYLIMAGSLLTLWAWAKRERYYVLLKARERSTARAKGAPPLTPNLDKQL